MTNKPPVYNQTPPVHYDEDEINLVDLWLVLVKRKLILVGVVVASAVAALLYVVVVPPSYQYSTSIEIGTRLNGTELSIVESPETVLAKVTETYIPMVLQDYFDQHPELGSVVKIDARVPKGSQIVVLNSKGSEDKGEIHKVLQQSVVEKLKKDHSDSADVLRKGLEILRNRLAVKLETLKNIGNTLILAREDPKLAKENWQDRESLTENRLTQSSVQDEITKLEIQLVSMRETRALLPPMRSPQPTGSGKTLIILLSLVLGLMLGMFAAFFAEFLSKVRGQSKSVQNA